MKKLILYLFLLCFAVFASCSSHIAKKENQTIAQSAVSAAGPDAIIYKTKADYNELVPVILNDDKTQIVSFPAPGDLKYKGQTAIPYHLADGFLLDNRGINANAAFLSITYHDYMALERTPSPEELNGMIIDKDPLLVMYNCGKRRNYQDEINELNAYILGNDFGNFVKLK